MLRHYIKIALRNFARRKGLAFITAWIFIIAGITASAIALFTVGFQAARAAAANPVKSLRTE